MPDIFIIQYDKYKLVIENIKREPQWKIGCGKWNLRNNGFMKKFIQGHLVILFITKLPFNGHYVRDYIEFKTLFVSHWAF